MNRSLVASSLLGFLLTLMSGAAALPPARAVEDRPVRIPEDPEWRKPCPLPPIPVPRDSPVLALKKTDVHIRVLGPIADVEVVQYYHNPATSPVDVGYTFPLPGDAAVRSVEMVTGDRTLKAELRELEEAKAIYEEARRAGNGALLVESERANVFRARIANVKPGDDLAVRIWYAQTLEPDGVTCRLTFPTVVAPRYCPAGQSDATIFDLPYVPSGLPGHAIAIDVAIDAGAALDRVASPSHAIAVETSEGTTHVSLGKTTETPNRDFILTWSMKPAASGEAAATLWTGPRTDFGIPFLLVAYPPRDVAEQNAAHEIVFILDSSGSMSGQKFAAATRALKGFLRGLGSRDAIRLIEFDDDFREMADKALPFSQATLDRADAWIDQVRADGGTEILQPLAHALALPADPERDRIVVLLTDGQVGNEDEVLAEATRHAGRTRIYTMGIDYAVNDAMLKGLARVTHGSCILMTPDEDVEGAILSLRKKFAAPVATNLALEMRGVAEIFPDPVPDLHAGEPLVLFGRTTASDPGRVRLTGRRGGKAWSVDLDVRNASADGVQLASVVAGKQIESLTDKMRSGDEDALKKRIIATSLAHEVASAFTGFVVVDRREEKTDTGAVRSVEVPVAFPQGWNWNTVFGREDRDRGSYPVVASSGYFGGAAMPKAAAPMLYSASAPAAYDGAYPDAAPRSSAGASSGMDAGELAVRFLARHQRANGMWSINGRDDAATTAAALVALLRSYAAHEAECDRAATALTRADALRSLASGAAVDRALVKLALDAAGSAMTGRNDVLADACRKAAAGLGQMPAAPAASRLAMLAASDRADDLREFLVAALSSAPSSEEGRAAAVARLSGMVESSDTGAGGLQLGGADVVEATALFAALDR